MAVLSIPSDAAHKLHRLDEHPRPTLHTRGCDDARHRSVQAMAKQVRRPRQLTPHTILSRIDDLEACIHARPHDGIWLTRLAGRAHHTSAPA